MSKEKVLNLTKYVNEVKSKLSEGIPEKHKGRERQYKAFLERELAMTNSKIEFLKMNLPAESKK